MLRVRHSPPAYSSVHPVSAVQAAPVSQRQSAGILQAVGIKIVLFIGKDALVSAASAIPIVGGPIATTVGMLDSELQSSRLEKIIVEIREQVNRLGVEKLDREFVNTERFQDAVLVLLDAARRTSDEHKRQLLAAILVGAARIDRIPDLEPDALLEALGSLSPRQVIILRTIHERASGSFMVTDLPGFGPDLAFDLKRLEAAGLFPRQPESRTATVPELSM